MLLGLLAFLTCLLVLWPVHAQPASPTPEVSADESAEYGAVATATRLPRPLGTVPAAMTVLRRSELDRNPGLTTDAVLRSVPSALTFRRSTSLTADPSAQGLNLRGVGPSGVSRTLVLVDGVPANDPFGGSIYWRALPRLGLQRIEIVPGGGSALYGSAALAGVVQLFTRGYQPSFEADALYGRFDTVQLAARGAHQWRKVGAMLEGELLRSDGYRVIAADQAGAVDGAAHSWHGTLNGGLELRATRDLTLRAGLRAFRESQNGGTRYTTAGVESGLLTLGGQLALAHGAELSVSLFARMQRFEQERARVAMGRSSEARAASQRVPANDQGASVVYRSRMLWLGGVHVLSAGLDVRRVQGTSHERIFAAMPGASSLARRSAGGEQLLGGVFIQDLYTIVPKVLELDAALRGDLVHNRDGERLVRRVGGAVEETDYAARNDLALSPRLGLLWRPLEVLTLRSSLYRAFRAPTLNELYRPFQVGTILTAANPSLQPELVHGFEGGVELTPMDGLVLRATGFWNRLERPISNVTLDAPLADGSQRQRQNLGFAVVRGVEASIEHRLAPYLSTLLAYTLAASEVRDGGGVPGLEGKRLVQDPLHRASFLLFFDAPWLSAALQVRVLGEQYEDDLNTLRMKPYALVDVSASRHLWWKLELYAAVENLLNTTYLVGRAGIDTVGQPLLVRGGLRIRDRR